ncbi:hypothetical protein MJT46_007638 [Ovis ammon polii x Ovis aries]|nr:hypothetical protein MJT46_007638 [Ovis ammon polii x Ovis aries]
MKPPPPPPPFPLLNYRSAIFQDPAQPVSPHSTLMFKALLVSCPTAFSRPDHYQRHLCTAKSRQLLYLFPVMPSYMLCFFLYVSCTQTTNSNFYRPQTSNENERSCRPESREKHAQWRSPHCGDPKQEGQEACLRTVVSIFLQGSPVRLPYDAAQDPCGGVLISLLGTRVADSTLSGHVDMYGLNMRCLAARVNYKTLIIICALFTLVTVLLWNKCSSDKAIQVPRHLSSGFRADALEKRAAASESNNYVNHMAKQSEEAFPQEQQKAPPVVGGFNNNGGGKVLGLKYEEIDCLINDEHTIKGRREGNEVFLPFTWVEKYFDVYGKVVQYDGYDRFEFSHSYSKVYAQRAPYHPDGVFMSFEGYNVEVRDRVKCISGVEGVPLSTQWGPQGYFYPIQIAQYGLSHYSKNLTEKPPHIEVYETAEDRDKNSKPSDWTVPKGCFMASVADKSRFTNVKQFIAPETSEGVSLQLGNTKDFIISFDLKFLTNGSVSVVLETTEKNQLFTVHYVSNTQLIAFKERDIYYGIGPRTSWSTVTRDLVTDLRKGVGLSNTKAVKPTRIMPKKVVRLIAKGKGFLDNITISTTAHMAAFFAASDWLVRNQDEKGGWPIMVTRKLGEGFKSLEPGWYSAMAQGQAISTLVRAYLLTKDHIFLSSALRATAPYKFLSEQHGVKAVFMNKHDWYEEYPTTPSSFVLNGFMYSLIGLYDLKETAGEKLGKEARSLYERGMESLKAMLPLYDTGSGTIYDLRHFMLGIAPNLARWDYHTTHINQLQLLSTIDESPIFKEFVKRWKSYLKGSRAKHN